MLTSSDLRVEVSSASTAGKMSSFRLADAGWLPVRWKEGFLVSRIVYDSALVPES